MEVIVFLLDGCRADAINESNTPIIHDLMGKGLWAKSCSTVYPSLTGPGHISILTGAYPEKTGIVGHFSWNREEGRLYDIFADKYCEVETIFETLQKNGVNGINFGAYMRRGSRDSHTRKLMGKLAGKISSSKSLMDFIDNRPGLYRFLRGFVVGRYDEFQRAFKGGEHRFYYVAFTEVDKAGHRYGPESDEYYRTLGDCDKKVGETLDLADSLKRDVTVIITADHGQTTLTEKLSLDTMNLDEIGYRTDKISDHSGSEIITYNEGKENMAVAAVVSRHVQVWLKKREDAYRVVKAFAQKKGVIYVKTKDELRSDHLYHDRVGDVSFCLASGYGFDFLKMAERGDHGGIDWTDMKVPLILYNKHMKAKGLLVNSATVDIAPTILTMLGFDGPPFMQGHFLFNSTS